MSLDSIKTNSDLGEIADVRMGDGVEIHGPGGNKDARRIYWSFNVVGVESNELNCLQVANNNEAKTVLTLLYMGVEGGGSL